MRPIVIKSHSIDKVRNARDKEALLITILVWAFVLGCILITISLQ